MKKVFTKIVSIVIQVFMVILDRRRRGYISSSDIVSSVERKRHYHYTYLKDRKRKEDK